jgi:hypothetical protein
LITVLGVLATGTNSILVSFDKVPKNLDSATFTSGVNPANYTLAAVDPTYSSATTPSYVAPGSTVPTRYPSIAFAELDEDAPTQVLLNTDTKLEPTVLYNLTVSSRIKGAYCETFAGTEVWQVAAPRLASRIKPQEAWEQRYRDFDFRGTIDGTEGYAFDAANDIALQDADRSLKKRIYRRLFSRTGDFVWAQGYGVGLSLKALARAGLLQTMADDVRRQILLEPDVIDCAVRTEVTQTTSGAFIDIQVAVRRNDARRLSFRVVEPLAS